MTFSYAHFRTKTEASLVAIPFAAGDNDGALTRSRRTTASSSRRSKYQVTAILAATNTYSEALTGTFAVASIQRCYYVVAAKRRLGWEK